MDAFIGTETYYTGIQQWSRDAVRAIRIGFVIKEADGKPDTPDDAIVRAYTDEQLEASGGLEPGDRVVFHAWNPDKRCFRKMAEVAPVTEIHSYLQSRRGRPSELALNAPPALELRVEMGPYRAVVDLDLGSLVIEGPGGFFTQGRVDNDGIDVDSTGPMSEADLSAVEKVIFDELIRRRIAMPLDPPEWA